MPIRVTRKLRRWGAALLVAAYAFGILAPAVAFAHADRAAIAHVLDEAHAGTLTLHFHPDGDPHDDSGKAGSKLIHHCCGVISLPGLEPAAELVIVQPVLTPTRFALSPRPLIGRGAARLDRPPRYLPPV